MSVYFACFELDLCVQASQVHYIACGDSNRKGTKVVRLVEVASSLKIAGEVVTCPRVFVPSIS
jgi:hypothetical protein